MSSLPETEKTFGMKLLQKFDEAFSETLLKILFKNEKLLSVNLQFLDCFRLSEAVVRRCSVEKVFLKILPNSQENKLQNRRFPLNFAEFLRIPFFTEHFRFEYNFL